MKFRVLGFLLLFTFGLVLTAHSQDERKIDSYHSGLNMYIEYPTGGVTQSPGPTDGFEDCKNTLKDFKAEMDLDVRADFLRQLASLQKSCEEASGTWSCDKSSTKFFWSPSEPKCVQQTSEGTKFWAILPVPVTLNMRRQCMCTGFVSEEGRKFLELKNSSTPTFKDF
jgi:hypothetical protein